MNAPIEPSPGETAASDHGAIATLSKLTLVVAGVALVGVACVEGWQVFARYVLNRSPSWTEPVALLLMSTAMMCGAAYGVRAKRHFGFFMLVEAMPPKLQAIVRLIPTFIAAGIGAIFFFYGAVLVGESWDFPMAGAPLPQGCVYLPICVGGLLIAIFAIESLIESKRVA